MDFIKSLLTSPLLRARILKALNGLSLVAGGWTMSHMYDWLMAHATFFSQADNLAIAGTVSAAVAGGVLTIGSAVYDQFDVSKVDAKITTAAVTGSVEAANDPEARKVVAAASPEVRQVITAASGSPEALKQVIDTLKVGGE